MRSQGPAHLSDLSAVAAVLGDAYGIAHLYDGVGVETGFTGERSGARLQLIIPNHVIGHAHRTPPPEPGFNPTPVHPPARSRVETRMAKLATSLRTIEGRTLVTMMVVVGAVLAFLGLGGEMREGETAGWDGRLLLLLRDPHDPKTLLGPGWLQECMRDLTAMGGVTLLTLGIGVAVVVLLYHRKRREALILGGVVICASLVGEVLKALYDRPRPNLVPHGTYFAEASFPSGHTTTSTTGWMTLALVVASLETRTRAKIFPFVIAAVVCVLTGISRVYFGVHWPSDVLAGWILGSGWALAAWALLEARARPALGV